MKIVFRVDASIKIGIGHVMRCLTLAGALRAEGAQCYFVCREHPGNLIDQIKAQGYQVRSLPFNLGELQLSKAGVGADSPTHAHWLGSDWKTDIRHTVDCIGSQLIDWLIVDHYALNEHWEKQIRDRCRKIMVIDDLADRIHDCDLLLDQTYGRSEVDYRTLAPVDCRILTGSKYALLRPEFSELREHSLQRRRAPKLKQLLITMGGIDKDNLTSKVLQALKDSTLPKSCCVNVVMGKHAPWIEEVKEQVRGFPWAVDVKRNVANMAQLMVESDLVIGAAGSTAWERCCLGLPSLMVVLADNQQLIANGLEACGAAINLGVNSVFLPTRIEDALFKLTLDLSRLTEMSVFASEVTEGQGAFLITEQILSGV